jgi:uncharacterized membrane-anchored protein
MDHNIKTTIADKRQPIAYILEDKNQARHERERARWNNLTVEQKEEINARRRAQNRAKLNSLTAEQNEEINASRIAQNRAKLQSLTDEHLSLNT